MRNKYHEKLKEYKYKCKSKRWLFWRSKFEAIEKSLGDSKLFWENWKNSGEVEHYPTYPNISGENWFNYFLKLHTEDRTEIIPNEDSQGNNNRNETTSTSGLNINEHFSKKEFLDVIQNLKNKKAEGFDSISNEMIKNAPTIILDLIHRYVNLCLDKSLISRTWCLGIINPIHKDDNRNDPSNYRGICISSVFLKIICSLLNNRIQKFCTKFNLINDNQIGFRKEHRTSDHLLTLKTIVKKYVTIGKGKLFACFVDFRKAYDSVCHNDLFQKLQNIGLSGKSIDLIIKDIYKKTNCAVRMGNAVTDFFDFSKGVRQGCPLSPILFNIFVNDIFEIINNMTNSNITLDNETKLNALMYADDLILLATSKEELQEKIDVLNDYCGSIKLEINEKKN